MIYAAGDLGVFIDFGSDEPGAVLQRKDDSVWREYEVGGKPVKAPIDIETLPPGEYRLVND